MQWGSILQGYHHLSMNMRKRINIPNRILCLRHPSPSMEFHVTKTDTISLLSQGTNQNLSSGLGRGSELLSQIFGFIFMPASLCIVHQDFIKETLNYNFVFNNPGVGVFITSASEWKICYRMLFPSLTIIPHWSLRLVFLYYGRRDPSRNNWVCQCLQSEPPLYLYSTVCSYKIESIPKVCLLVPIWKQKSTKSET